MVLDMKQFFELKVNPKANQVNKKRCFRRIRIIRCARIKAFMRHLTSTPTGLFLNSFPIQYKYTQTLIPIFKIRVKPKNKENMAWGGKLDPLERG